MSRWPTKPLGELCDLVAGGTPARSRPDFYNGGIPWVKIGDMVQGRVSRTAETISFEGLANSAAKLLAPGTVLISIFATIGRTAVLDIEAATNQAIVGVSPRNPSELMPPFVRYFLEQSVANLTSQARGVAQLNINGAILKKLPIPVPPAPEQERIVKLLDEADALRKMRADADARTNRLIPALFHEMFGDETSLPIEELGELISSGPQNGLYKHSSYYGEGCPILRIDAFYDGQVEDVAGLKKVKITPEELANYALRENDIVVNRVNSVEYLGKSALIPPLLEPTVFESNMMRFSLSRDAVEPVYAIQALQTTGVKQQILTSAKHSINQSSINQQDVKSIRIPLPPLTLQRQFAERVSEIRALESSQIECRERLDGLFQSMLHRAFEGAL